MNILNLFQLLALATFLGAVNCKTLVDFKNEIESAKQTGLDKKLKEQIITALSHPQVFIDSNYDLAEMMKNKTGLDKDEPYKFYRLDEKVQKQVDQVIKDNDYEANINAIEEFKDTIAIKKMFLLKIFSEIPVLKGSVLSFDSHDNLILLKPDSTNTNADFAIQGQLCWLIQDNLTFDGTRLTFSNLHKFVESLKAVFEVDRKGNAAVQAIINEIDSIIKEGKSETWLTEVNGNGIPDNQVKIKLSSDNDSKKTGSKSVKETNIFKIAIKASEKSTSCPNRLAIVVFTSLALAIGLIVFKTYTSKSVEEEEEVEEEEAY